jgi:hypothetical protein
MEVKEGNSLVLMMMMFPVSSSMLIFVRNIINKKREGNQDWDRRLMKMLVIRM